MMPHPPRRPFPTARVLRHLAAMAAVTLVAGLAKVHAQPTETVSGIFEKGTPQSAIFALSPGSGDLMGYFFNTQSPLGKAVLKYCLTGMPCKLEQAQLRDPSSNGPLGLKETPSVWFEVAKVQGVGLDSANLPQQSKLKTRFGVVHIDSANRLNFKGTPVQPTVEGNAALSIVASYAQKQQDVLLLQSTGGSACPVQLRFATVDASGIRVTPEFGTCSDYYYPLQTGNAINVAIAAQDPSTKALKKTIFKYANGKITQQP